MIKNIISLFVMSVFITPAYAVFDSNTQTLTSTSTATATNNGNGGNGGAGGSGGTGGTAFGGTAISGSSTGASTATTGASNATTGASTASNGGNSYNSTEVRQYRIAPPVSIGAATGVDGMGISTPFGGASYNKGNRFNNALALYNLKAANGMDCAREIAIMERETQESCFLGILPIDTPFGLGQMKPLAHYSEPAEKKSVAKTTVITKSTVGNGGNFSNGTQTVVK